MRRRDMMAALAAASLSACVRDDRRALPALADRWFEAERVGRLRVTVWTPPGYRADRPRPVLYMHDGQNLFDPAVSGYGKVWHVDRAVERLALGDDAPIVVGVWNPGEARFRTYLPHVAIERLPRAVTDAAAPRIGAGPVVSDAYLAFLAGPLKAAIDRDYATRPGRDDTTIMGSSMGGLISLYAFVRHPETYGSAGCVSTHWPVFIPEGDGVAVPFAAEVTAMWTNWLRAELGPPDGRRLWFDHGTATLDALYAPYQAAVDALLPMLGWRRGEDFESRVYEGAPHEENAWAARVQEPLEWLYRRA
ncbi:alpha/beta hydrolase [Sphingomonas sp.]